MHLRSLMYGKMVDMETSTVYTQNSLSIVDMLWLPKMITGREIVKVEKNRTTGK